MGGSEPRFMMLIVDASVVLKWVLTEDGTDRACALITADTFAAPDLLWVEGANVLWARSAAHARYAGAMRLL